jgi:hypothetical protein
VPHFRLFTDEEVEAFVQAATDNSEVWDASLCASEYIPEFVRVNGARISAAAAKALLEVLPDLELPRRTRAR